jgi:surface carbohydrate biosynthesis protein (TIGR04326 family)
LERGKNSLTTDKPALLVYSNPNSHPEGKDGYFGDLMKNQSQLTRILHVDGSLDRARHLSTGNRTSCLDAWGSFFEVLKLPLVRWKTPEQDSATPFKWLIRRALSKEGSTAQAAAIAWQVACQKRWLKKSRPSIVVWPWENHGWEREFVRQTRHLNIETLGYQHSVIGPQMLNYSSASNHDGQTSLPDHILCSGYATLNQLLNWGLPRNKLSIGGAFRIPIIKEQKSDPNAPIFLALPFDGRIAHQMIDAATLLIEKGYRFLVKDHPMTPYKFSESDELKRTDRPYHAIEKLSAVIYAATTVGLETAIAGLPTIRFLPEGLIGMNILPQEVILPAASAVNLASVLKNIIPPNLSRDDIFSPVPMDTWQKWLNK